MSKIIASAAIRGAYKIVNRAEAKWHQALNRWGRKEPVGFPNTAYYLPVIYGMTGHKVETLGDMETVLNGVDLSCHPWSAKNMPCLTWVRLWTPVWRLYSPKR